MNEIEIDHNRDVNRPYSKRILKWCQWLVLIGATLWVGSLGLAMLTAFSFQFAIHP